MKRPLALTLLAVFDIFAALAALMWVGASLAILHNDVSRLQAMAMVLVAGTLFAVSGILLWRASAWGRYIQTGFACVSLSFALVMILLLWPLGLFMLLWGGFSLVYLNRRGMRRFLSGGSREGLGEADMDKLKKHTRAGSVSALAVTILSALGIPALALLGGLAVPNVLNVLNWDRTKITMSRMRELATAIELYYVDENAYPAADSMQALAGFLVPAYIKEIPPVDGWGRPWRLQTWTQNAAAKGPDSYALASAGQDGVWEKTNLRDYPQNLTHSFDTDIVFSNGIFVQCKADHDHEEDCQ
jgi:hypothetical protein